MKEEKQRRTAVKEDIKSLEEAEIAAPAQSHGEAAFRGKQISHGYIRARPPLMK